MTDIVIAKPIIEDRYWILTDGSTKIGNLIADSGGYEVKINGASRHYTSIDEVAADVELRFEGPTPGISTVNPLYQDLPVDGQPHNIMLDVKRKLQLYTKEDDSKCYYACGYFNIMMGDRWQTVLCPKYIYIQRYQWNGPYDSIETARQNLDLDK